MDDLAGYKRVLAQQAVDKVGASPVFLPPYSPDFTRIEQACVKRKQRLRTVNARAGGTVTTAPRGTLSLDHRH